MSIFKDHTVKREKFEIIAKTFQGLEDVLAEEIINLGGDNVSIGRRMVSFTGDLELLYKANLHCRTALRILKPIYSFTASDTDEVYTKIKEVPWEKYLTPQQTFSIDSVVYSEEFKHSKFVTYRAKDAIADYFTDKGSERPSVRINNPDITLNLHISGHNCTLSLDSSGESLHKRGYRVRQTEAPINEVLAAGMILKTGWRGDSAFLDPMCGSGTILIEAALIALNIAPGIYRQGFGFEKWNDYDEELFERLYNDDSFERPFGFTIYGSDISPKAVSIAEENIKSAGVSKYIDLQVKPLQQYENAPADKGVIVTNPPYGERLSSQDLLGLYEMIGERLKHVFKGYDAWIISYRDECFDKIGLKPATKIDLMNGALECQYRKYEIFSGKYNEFKKTTGGFREKRMPAPGYAAKEDARSEKREFHRDSPQKTDFRSRDKKEPGKKFPERRNERFGSAERQDKKPDRKPFEKNRPAREEWKKPSDIPETAREVPRWKILRDANLKKEEKPRRERFYGSRPPVSERFKNHKKKTGDDENNLSE